MRGTSRFLYLFYPSPVTICFTISGHSWPGLVVLHPTQPRRSIQQRFKRFGSSFIIFLHSPLLSSFMLSNFLPPQPPWTSFFTSETQQDHYAMLGISLSASQSNMYLQAKFQSITDFLNVLPFCQGWQTNTTDWSMSTNGSFMF